MWIAMMVRGIVLLGSVILFCRLLLLSMPYSEWVRAMRRTRQRPEAPKDILK